MVYYFFISPKRTRNKKDKNTNRNICAKLTGAVRVFHLNLRKAKCVIATDTLSLKMLKYFIVLNMKTIIAYLNLLVNLNRSTFVLPSRLILVYERHEGLRRPFRWVKKIEYQEFCIVETYPEYSKKAIISEPR